MVTIFSAIKVCTVDMNPVRLGKFSFMKDDLRCWGNCMNHRLHFFSGEGVVAVGKPNYNFQ